jgi:hypothetical protein
MEKSEVRYFGRMFALFRPEALIDPFVEGQDIDLRLDDAIAKLLEDRDCLQFVLGGLIGLAIGGPQSRGLCREGKGNRLGDHLVNDFKVEGYRRGSDGSFRLGGFRRCGL